MRAVKDFTTIDNPRKRLMREDDRNLEAELNSSEFPEKCEERILLAPRLAEGKVLFGSLLETRSH